MNTLRSIMVGATAAGLLGLPVAAPAAPTASAPAASAQAGRYNTSVRFLDFDHTRGFGTPTTIRGQVVVPALGGAVKGVRVKLYRKLDGSSRWKYLQTKYTLHKTYPRFRFTAASLANADYRVVYAGNDRLKPSRNATGVSVYRNFAAKLEDGTGRFHGRITPHYAHRTVFLDRRRCASCGWHRVRSTRTGDRGRFSFTVNAPSHGAFYWRASTPASTRFIRSYSAVFTTRRG